MSVSRRSPRWVVWFCAATAMLAGCNLFDPLDSPTGDQQILSAARACFDAGDIACARAWYAKLSNGSADARESEEAFALLHEAGATMAAFVSSVGKGEGGKGLTALAGLLSANAGEARRALIFEGYQKVQGIVLPELRGLVRFVAGFSLAAELLAEDSLADGSLLKSELTTDAASCSCSLLCVCTAGCDPPSSSILTMGSDVDLLTSPASVTLTGAPTLKMIYAAVRAVEFALTNELVASGSFQTGTGGFIGQLTSLNLTTDQCHRYGLVSNGVGL